MAEVRECFACGVALARSDERYFDVERDDRSMIPRAACSGCYNKAVAHGSIPVPHGGKVYVCRPRTLQRDLFGRTFKHLTRDGGKHV